ncbi:MAG: radical SAM family heme chaperone HemW [Syntrophobacterales bacterium]|jgi:oxygen-independent coproporphyrinogen-3 oxidase|nr:radical SAM family heme chaperone HemW [Syntrophobacterales bacterium]
MSLHPLTSPGLYVHVPFCQTKCPYCDFYSVTSTERLAAYLTALDAEARLYREQFPAFDSLFLGGGTPSLLDAVQLSTLLKTLRRYFAFAPDTEFTLEANPDDISADKLHLYRDLGVNRLSLGAQSFDEAELIFLKRRHTARQTRQAIELIRAAGFANLGFDLIYGLPGQRPEAWLRTLETALSFTPEHLSCYQLTLADDTPMGRQAAAGEVQPLGEEAQRNFFLLTDKFLTERGYLHYEVANFARQEEPQAGGRRHYRCRHNLKYWTHVPYLGLGPGAHSFQAGRRWWNHRSLQDYCAALDAGLPPVAGAETLTPAQLRLETLYLGFRTQDGVALATLKDQPGWEAILTELTGAGLVEVRHDRVVATPKGLVVADRLPLWFAA